MGSGATHGRRNEDPTPTLRPNAPFRIEEQSRKKRARRGERRRAPCRHHEEQHQTHTRNHGG